MVTKSISVIGEPMVIFDDSDFSNGSSTSAITQSYPNVEVDCLLDTQYSWPYCELEFDLREDSQVGLNLSNMDKVVIELRATYNEEPLTDQALRLHAKNHDIELPTESKIKTNHIEFFVEQGNATVELPLAYLQVADWWKKDHQIPLEMSFADITNVIHLSIATPSNAAPGLYRLTISKLEIVGPWISAQFLYLLLLCVWIVAAAVYLVFSYTLTKHKVFQLKVQNRQLKKSNQQIQTLASFDSLTGALNRHGSMSIIRSLEHSRFGILYIDLDHFKSLNDRYGHEIGDSVLKDFSTMMKEFTTPRSHFVRWGGEEFILIIENTNLDDCIELAESIQQTMLQKERFDGREVTCSIGIAINTNGLTFDSVLDSADRALYAAKSQGRNCIQAA
jgi:diguanylate cyclase (GGDEF)-like protein